MRTGSDYLAALQDSREVILGSQRVTDVTEHPAFRNAARSIANLYDLVANTDDPYLTYREEDGSGPYNRTWQRPVDVEDLKARHHLHLRWSEATNGLIGRSPDHIASFIAGMAALPSVADRHGQGFGQNIVRYWEHARNNDLYVTYAIVSPGRARGPVAGAEAPDTAVRVVEERDDGVVVRGMKILATAAVFADELLVGNIYPLNPGDEKYAITFAIPMGTAGLKIIPRRSYEQYAPSILDNPLAIRFDEGDAVVFFDDVLVPWERVFAHNQLDTPSALFSETPAHLLGNHQAQVRYLTKLRLALGVTDRVTEETGTGKIPAVRGELADLATTVSVAEALVTAQLASPAKWDGGYLSYDAQTLHAASSWMSSNYPGFIHRIRLLLGSHPFQQAADSSVWNEPEIAGIIANAFGASDIKTAQDHYKLINLAWDLVGSEFASRHLQYELFYAGAAHITRARAYQSFRWEKVREAAEVCLRGINEWQRGGTEDATEDSLSAGMFPASE